MARALLTRGRKKGLDVTPPHSSTSLVAVELARDYLHVITAPDDDGGDDSGRAVQEVVRRLDARLRELTDDPEARDLIGMLASLAAGLAHVAGRGLNGAEVLLDAMAVHTLSVEVHGGD
jgi:hypothetical protein